MTEQNKQSDTPAPGMSRELMGLIVDEVFDGAMEDASVIEEIYAVIKRHEAVRRRDVQPGSFGIEDSRVSRQREHARAMSETTPVSEAAGAAIPEGGGSGNPEPEAHVEPVAWQWRHPRATGGEWYHAPDGPRPFADRRTEAEYRPLYAHPPAPQTRALGPNTESVGR
ncbi:MULTISPECIES: hypothetical protein [unclassified Rhizobium]|uniref:hypothetical protein n=1 Tax=unclassified Rhizobium TaxID=2613769 RepID=UPI001AE30311|nr:MULTISPECIES: hypothetical protein [unclassified Rhizobium]MBP2462089.1 hypothetical protein [Rhizobium sp. PvP014]MBP2529485.1 hypothetical protein [Rhizobium sp. PvP099]